MNHQYPNPWDFDGSVPSPDGKYRMEYGGLFEIAMGAPLGSYCFLVREKDNERIQIAESAGGPAIWNQESSLLAFPVWTKNRSQQIRTVNAETGKITTYSKIFRVLELYRFEGSVIKGIDSPIHHTESVHFDTESEKISSRTDLTYVRTK